MPNKKSAIKELRKAKKRSVHNARIKTNFKFLFAKAKNHAVKGEMEEAKKAAVTFQVAADKAAKVRVVSKNRANRKKSTLMKMLSAKKA